MDNRPARDRRSVFIYIRLYTFDKLSKWKDAKDGCQASDVDGFGNSLGEMRISSGVSINDGGSEGHPQGFYDGGQLVILDIHISYLLYDYSNA